jgi:hypothetical protein
MASWWFSTHAAPIGCMPCGPPVTVDGTLAWQLLHSAIVPAWPWSATLCRLSFSCDDGYSACVEPWQAAHCRPPCPAEKR